jgi:hypothetical protein
VSRRPPHVKDRGAPAGEEAVCGSALEQPAWGQLRAAHAWAERGIPSSAAGGRWGGERKGWEHLNQRVRALAAKVARERPLLTEAPRAAFEQAEGDQEAPGGCESACPGYCGAPATCSVGTLTGVGRISQQTFIAPYSKGALAKLSDGKTSLTAAELLNDPGVPFFAAPELPLSRLLTERGTE